MSKIFKNPTDLKMRALPHYQRANRLSLGTLDIIRITIKNFSLSRGAEAAASLSYYAIFSLFPLLLVMVSVAGFLINSEQAYQAVLDAIGSILPGAVDLRSSCASAEPSVLSALWEPSGPPPRFSTPWSGISTGPG